MATTLTTGTNRSSGMFNTSGGSRSSGGGASPELANTLKLLQGILGENAALRGERRSEVGAVRDTRADYSKENAFADSQALMAQQLKQSLQGSMSTLNRATEGAGASGSSLRALLAQQAAKDAAQSAAALGAQQAVQYGGISNQASGVLEALTRPDDASLNALLQALAIQQRAQAESASQYSGSGSKQKTGSSLSNSQRGGVSVAKDKAYTSAPVVYSGSGGGSSSSGLPGGVSHIFSQPNYTSNVLGGLQYYGPQVSDQSLISNSFMQQGNSIESRGILDALQNLDPNKQTLSF